MKGLKWQASCVLVGTESSDFEIIMYRAGWNNVNRVNLDRLGRFATVSLFNE